MNQVLRRDPSARPFAKNNSLALETGLVDFHFSMPGEPNQPESVFDRLRWGGQFIFISKSKEQVLRHSQRFHGRGGFDIDQGLGSARLARWGMNLPLIGETYYYFAARKVMLVPPGQTNRRFTFDVRLTRNASIAPGYLVLKQVPSYSNIVQRLTDVFPDTNLDTIANRARKLVDRVFPVFLTREAAFLNLLQRDLPEQYRHRVPQVLAVKKDENGLVQQLYLNWLRLGGGPISQLEFAKQSADLLRALHETVKIIHLDLRLDNIVITKSGVGFLDFGSAVRVGEDISESPMLKSLFDELMSTSQIQKTLGQMKASGLITSKIIGDAHQRVDQAVDLFHLAIQMNKPHSNPDFLGLVEYNPESEEARRLSRLTDAILRPKDPCRPRFLSAKQVLMGIERIENSIRRRQAEGDDPLAQLARDRMVSVPA